MSGAGEAVRKFEVLHDDFVEVEEGNCGLTESIGARGECGGDDAAMLRGDRSFGTNKSPGRWKRLRFWAAAWCVGDGDATVETIFTKFVFVTW